MYEPAFEPAYDTGSDAWERAQAEAAAEAEAAVAATRAAAEEPAPLIDQAGDGPADVLAAGNDDTGHDNSGNDGTGNDGTGNDSIGSDSTGADWQLGAPAPEYESGADAAAAGSADAAAVTVWARAPQEEPAAPTRAARRAAAHQGEISPMRAVAGAAVAVAGVALGIAALLWVRGDAPQGSPTVERPQAVGASSTPSSATPVTPTTPPVIAPTTPTPTVTEPSPTGSSTTAPATPAKAPVTVLNNSRRTGLASEAAQRFAAGGWTIRDTGNFRGQVATTSVYYAPGQEAVARSFAAQFGISRVAPRFATLPGTGLTVVLTRDYRG